MDKQVLEYIDKVAYKAAKLVKEEINVAETINQASKHAVGLYMEQQKPVLDLLVNKTREHDMKFDGIINRLDSIESRLAIHQLAIKRAI